ncbi:MAG: hypothetical protein Q8J71_08680 [Brevundimonas sp.]|jgi:hypothetical protein|nr:hypothetical protein [Brevundimonas sp.]
MKVSEVSEVSHEFSADMDSCGATQRRRPRLSGQASADDPEQGFIAAPEYGQARVMPAPFLVRMTA